MTLLQKVKAACAIAGISEAELARRLETTPQNFFKRLRVGKFTVEEMEKIGAALGAEYSFSFRFPDGTVI